MIWWHVMKGHLHTISRVTVPRFDPWSKGLLITCECGKVWAK